VEETVLLQERVPPFPPDNTLVFFLSRLRCANGEPVLLEKTYIPYYLCKGIQKHQLGEA
jgi:GntR family transcriptional regulator